MRLFGFGRGKSSGGFSAETATFLCVRTGAYTAVAEQNIDDVFAALRLLDRGVRGIVDRHQGRILNAFNGQFAASFAAAPAALKAALEVVGSEPLSELDRAHPRIPLICGLHAGQIYCCDGHHFGSSISTAEWVCGQGRNEDVVLSDTVAPLVEPHLPQEFALRKGAMWEKGAPRWRALFFVVSREQLALERRAAFISYRRGGGSEIARLVASELNKRGVETFLDLDNMHAAHFDEQIYSRIESMSNFVLILTPGCLDRCKEDGDWLRREIAHALKSARTIVPVMTEGFTFLTRSELPRDINELPRHHGVRYTHDFAAAAFDKVASFLRAG